MPPSPKHTPFPATPQPPSLEALLDRAQTGYKAAVALEKEAGKEIKVQRATMLRLQEQIRQRDEAEAARKLTRLEGAMDPKKPYVLPMPVPRLPADIGPLR